MTWRCLSSVKQVSAHCRHDLGVGPAGNAGLVGRRQPRRRLPRKQHVQQHVHMGVAYDCWIGCTTDCTVTLATDHRGIHGNELYCSNHVT